MWCLVFIFIYIDPVRCALGGDDQSLSNYSSSSVLRLNGRVMPPRRYYCVFRGELLKASCDASPWYMGTSRLTYYHIELTTGRTPIIRTKNTIYMRVDDNTCHRFTCEGGEYNLKTDHKNPAEDNQTLYTPLSIHPRIHMGISGTLLFVVNGLFLLPSGPYLTGTELRYEYEFYDGEEIKIITYYEPYYSQNLHIQCSVSGYNKPKVSFTTTDSNVELISFTLHREQRNLTVSCHAFNDMESRKMILVLTYDPFSYYPYITGLSLAKTLLKYSPNCTTTIVNYEYTSESGLTLTCSSYSIPSNYNYDDKEIEGYLTIERKEEERRQKGVMKRSRTIYLKLRPHVNSATITCTSRNGQTIYTTVVNIIRATRSADQEQFEDIFSGRSSSYGSNHRTTKTDSHKETTNENMTEGRTKEVWSESTTTHHSANKNLFICLVLVGSGTVAAGAVLLAVVVVKGWKNKCLEDAPSESAGGGGGLTLHRAHSAATLAAEYVCDHVYETVQEHIYDEPVLQTSSNSTPAPVRDSRRPPYPLPYEAREETDPDQPYRHYETPYAFRIFRIGVPVVQWPDRFRRGGLRNGERISQSRNRLTLN